MAKIEIHNLNELIQQNYPQEIVEKMIQEVLMLSMLVKNDYPDYKEWYTKEQEPRLYKYTRIIIIANINERMREIGTIKKKKTEKKICTFYVEKSFRRNKIGTILVEKAVEFLEESRPLITIPMDKLNEFIRIANKYNWEITDIKENLYRTSTPEVIVNGIITETNQSLIQEKSLQKVYRIYKIERIKQVIRTILNNPQFLWK